MGQANRSRRGIWGEVCRAHRDAVLFVADERHDNLHWCPGCLCSYALTLGEAQDFDNNAPPDDFTAELVHALLYERFDKRC